VVILLSAAFTGNGLSQELHLALMRVGEVIVGSTVALLQTVIYMWLLKVRKTGPGDEATGS
jgi:hypothetical protein